MHVASARICWQLAVSPPGRYSPDTAICLIESSLFNRYVVAAIESKIAARMNQKTRERNMSYTCKPWNADWKRHDDRDRWSRRGDDRRDHGRKRDDRRNCR